jgi:uroporphyrinogen decarboxylase
MASMTPKERVKCVLARDIPDRVPYVEVGVDFPFICRLLAMDLPTGKYFEAGEYESPPIDIQLKVNQKLHRDIVVYNMLPPIPAVKHPGVHGILFFSEGKIKTWEDLEQLALPDPTSDEFLAPAVRFLKQAGEYATVCTCRLGISATYLALGMEHFFYTLHDDPRLVEELLRQYTAFCARVVEQASKLGFDLFWTSDDIAFKSGPFFAPGMFKELFLPQVRKVADQIQELGIPWIFHSDGNMAPLIEDLIGLGVRGLNPVEPACMDIREIKNAYGDRLILCGNVDVKLLSEGSQEQVREATLALLREVAPEGGFMLASGNSVTSYCKVENVRAMCDTLSQHGHYPIFL